MIKKNIIETYQVLSWVEVRRASKFLPFDQQPHQLGRGQKFCQ